MPLQDGCDYKIIRKNISKLVKEGKPLKQAVAISLDYASKQGCDIKQIQAGVQEHLNSYE